ncbi:MAG: hypothetical protein AABW73_01540 [Nanoarchaeota archaeon]
MYYNFGTKDSLNLGEITVLGMQVLEERAQSLGAEILSLGELEETPEKGYTAKTELDIGIKGGKGRIGTSKLQLVLFRPRDGTGTRESYALERLPPKLTPRRKDGVAELFMTVGTGYRNMWWPGINNLRELTVNAESGLRELYPLGLEEGEWAEIVSGRKGLVAPKKTAFAYTHDSRTGYGNPHAIIFSNPQTKNLPRIDDIEPLFQLAAFLKFEDDKGLEIVDKLVIKR